MSARHCLVAVAIYEDCPKMYCKPKLYYVRVKDQIILEPNTVLISAINPSPTPMTAPLSHHYNRLTIPTLTQILLYQNNNHGRCKMVDKLHDEFECAIIYQWLDKHNIFDQDKYIIPEAFMDQVVCFNCDNLEHEN